MNLPPPNQPTVLITDAGRGSALAFIRSLGRAGFRVIAADWDPASVGFRSRWVNEKLIYPEPTADPEAYLAAILNAVEHYEVDLVVPITDESLLPLSDSRDLVPPNCRLAIAEADALEIVTNKLKTIELAERLGVPLPKSALVKTVDEALAAANDLTVRPLVLKPIVSRLFSDESPVEKLTVCYANDLDALEAEMQRFEGRCPVLLQEYTGGIGVGVELLMHRGRPLAAFQHKRLREFPVSGGASSLRESVPLDPVLYDHSLRLLRELEWTGLAMVEFKLGDDGPMLMEINGRVWGSMPLAAQSSIDFPRLLADMMLDDVPLLDRPQSNVDCSSALPRPGKPCERSADHRTGQADAVAQSAGEPPRSDYRLGVRARNPDLDVLWIATVLFQKRTYSFLPMPRRREAIGALLGLLNPRIKSDFFSLSDPLPGLVQVPRLIRKLWGKLAKHRGKPDQPLESVTVPTPLVAAGSAPVGTLQKG